MRSVCIGAKGDVRSYLRQEVETVAASIPQQAASPPVQLIIQNSSTAARAFQILLVQSQVSSTQPEKEQQPVAPVPQRLSQLSRRDLSDFWASPLRPVSMELKRYFKRYFKWFQGL